MPGISTGNRLRMRGQGEASQSLNGSSGDLYIEIDVEPHPWFERDGPDLLMALPLNFADLTLGTTVDIPHIDSENLRIIVPAGSNPGETITIPGRGLPSNVGKSNRGSVTVVLRLQSPKNPSRKLKKKIDEIRAELEASIPTVEERIRDEARLRRGR
jgi:molecular chaperone DnaJ